MLIIQGAWFDVYYFAKMSANTNILQTPEPLAKQGIPGQNKEK